MSVTPPLPAAMMLHVSDSDGLAALAKQEFTQEREVAAVSSLRPHTLVA
jgi:hypothetical protein